MTMWGLLSLLEGWRNRPCLLKKNLSPFQNHSLVFLITTMKSFKSKDEENKITHKMLTLPRFTNLTSKALQPIKTKGGNTLLLGYSTVTRTAGGVEHEPLQQQESCPVTGQAGLPLYSSLLPFSCRLPRRCPTMTLPRSSPVQCQEYSL